MVESDFFQKDAAQRQREEAMYWAAFRACADALRGPTGRGTPPKFATVKRTLHRVMKNPDLQIVNTKGFRPVLSMKAQPKPNPLIERILEGVK